MMSTFKLAVCHFNHHIPASYAAQGSHPGHAELATFWGTAEHMRWWIAGTCSSWSKQPIRLRALTGPLSSLRTTKSVLTSLRLGRPRMLESCPCWTSSASSPRFAAYPQRAGHWPRLAYACMQLSSDPAFSKGLVGSVGLLRDSMTNA